MTNKNNKKDEIDFIEEELEYEVGKKVNPTKAVTKMLISGIIGASELLLVITTGLTCYFVLKTDWNNAIPKLALIPQAALAVAITVKSFLGAAFQKVTKGDK